MMNRIDNKFNELKAAGKKGLVIYITAGLPDAAGTLKAVLEAEKAGADIIEIGIPSLILWQMVQLFRLLPIRQSKRV